MIGLDTGFFLRVFENHDEARRIWGLVIDGRERAAVSALSLFELSRHALRGKIHHEKGRQFVQRLPVLCRVAWIADLGVTEQAARLAHGNGLAAADALILASLMRAGIGHLYTTDSDFEAYQAGPRITIL